MKTHPNETSSKSALRTARLIAAKKADSKRRREAVLKAIAAHTKAGRSITAAGIARSAGVSTWLIYNAPDLLEAVRSAAAQNHAKEDVDRKPTDSAPTINSLRNEVLMLNARLTRTAAERDQLKKALRNKIGAQLELETTGELKTRIGLLERSLERARLDLEDSQSRNSLLRDDLEDAQDELRAARRINQMLVKENSQRGSVVPFRSTV
ncbi:hypothetical protein SAMN04488693_1446 [Arthrobacter subterraneus]|uniref:Transposase n=1 Tax=Arthrobacter subterraneus TaxID=335973 RepID=A0A1G8Q6D5_9MICC|nr:hypothetical protein [Arthrobacter subterraneus]SDJ00241.1 hypothetical protein SAMN04488693_1446 [Arthrobacter subterraneus]